MFNPKHVPFRDDSDKRTIASKEDYLSECEMIESDHETACLAIMAFDETDFAD